jgi:CRP-like cAMP-binding protein
VDPADGADELQPDTAPNRVFLDDGGESDGDDGGTDFDVSVQAKDERPADPAIVATILKRVPLFAGVSGTVLRSLCGGANIVDVPSDEFLFHEGTDALSFFVVIDGTFDLTRTIDGREVRLRQVKDNEPFGLFGLFAEKLRAASAKAVTDCVVLEISGATLQTLMEADDALHQRLLAFYRQRLVEDFLASRFFSDVDAAAIPRLTSRFASASLEAGQTLVHPGEVVNTMAIVTHGRLLLEFRATAGQAAHQIEVSQGEFVVLACALSGAPSRFRVFAPEYSTISVLGHRELVELMRDYPALRVLPSRLAQHAQKLDRDVFCGSMGTKGH